MPLFIGYFFGTLIARLIVFIITGFFKLINMILKLTWRVAKFTYSGYQ